MYCMRQGKNSRTEVFSIGGFLFDGDIYMEEDQKVEYEKESFVLV